MFVCTRRWRKLNLTWTVVTVITQRGWKREVRIWRASMRWRKGKERHESFEFRGDKNGAGSEGRHRSHARAWRRRALGEVSRFGRPGTDRLHGQHSRRSRAGLRKIRLRRAALHRFA